MKLSIENISKKYYPFGQKTIEVLQAITLLINENDFYVILGPSGCGKTTLLRIIAGLEKQTEGNVLMNNKVIDGPGKERGMVFQSYTSFPWLTVKENISFGLTLNGCNKKDAEEVVKQYIEFTGLQGFEDYYPKGLSGGMKQRVAIARCLANNPDIILMDEPFGSLDVKTRWQMQEMVQKLRKELRKTIVFVTHDVEEAVFLSNRLCVLSPRPAQIVKEIEIKFTNARDLRLKGTKEFMEIEQSIHSIIRNEGLRIS